MWVEESDSDDSKNASEHEARESTSIVGDDQDFALHVTVHVYCFYLHSAQNPPPLIVN